MEKTNNNAEVIEQLLKTMGPMSIDQIYYELSDREGFSERVIKETILRLREQGRIGPNHEWKMEIK
jgi:predicted transcriptional regulator